MKFHMQNSNDDTGLPLSPELDINAAFKELADMQERAGKRFGPDSKRTIEGGLVFEEDLAEPTAEESFFGGDPFSEEPDKSE